MPYPGQFIRLVIMGTMQGQQDIWNTTLSIVPSALGELGMLAPDQATVEAIADDVEAWFPQQIGAGCGFINAIALTGIKLNRIGTDGKYTEAASNEFIYPAPIAGVAPTNTAPQLTMVATLQTAVPRGRASKGRMYLPPNAASGTPLADGRTSSANALGTATGVVDLIERINATYVGIGRVGVASDAGAGRFEHVTEVRVGRVIDTMRSRRSSFEEDYEIAPV